MAKTVVVLPEHMVLGFMELVRGEYQEFLRTAPNLKSQEEYYKWIQDSVTLWTESLLIGDRHGTVEHLKDMMLLCLMQYHQIYISPKD